MNKSPTKLLILWGALVATILFLSWARWPENNWLAADFASLLPSTSGSEWEKLATTQSTAAFSRQLVLMAEGPDSTEFLHEAAQNLTASGYIDSMHEAQQAELWGRFIDLSKPYARGLVTSTDFAKIKADPDSYIRQFQASLYSPLGSRWINSLPEDPLGLYQNFLFQTASRIPHGGSSSYAVLQVLEDRLDFNSLDGLYSKYRELTMLAESRGITFHATGAPLYSSYGVESARKEISTIGLVSAITLVLVLLLILRSPVGLLLTVIVVMSGTVGGFAITLAVYQQLHIMALVFGATLIGISADYAFHYICHSFSKGWHPEDGLRCIFQGLVLSVASTATAFLALTLVPFPGLQQIGLFMASGLLCSFSSVCLILPALYRRGKHFAIMPEKLALKVPLVGSLTKQAVAIILITLPGIYLLQPQDDIREFYATPDDLERSQTEIQNSTGSKEESQYLLLFADDQEGLLQMEERVVQRVPGLKPGITAMVPSAARQADAVRLGRELTSRDHVQSHMRDIGIDEKTITAYVSEMRTPFTPMSLQNLEKQQLPINFGGFLGCRDGHCSSWLALDGSESPEALSQAIHEELGITLIQPVSKINGTLEQYRGWASVLFLMAGLTVLLILWRTLGLRLATKVLLLPVLSCLLSLGLLGYLQNNYSVVNVLALYIVAGLGLDFSIFLHVTKNKAATRLAIMLSALTTMLAFGMLSLSATPIISDFGITIGSGLFFAWLLSWIQTKTTGDHQE